MIPFDSYPLLFSLLLLLGFYFLGSIPFALVWARAFGLPDPRTYGSGNPGASNIARSGSRPAAALTFLCDALKGAAVLVPKALGIGGADLWGALGIVAVVGHSYPAFLRFRGGKGVATAFGVLLALDWRAAAVAAVVWVCVFALARISALASLAAVALAGAALAMPGESDLTPATHFVLLAVVLVRHRDNLRRLAGKSENRFQ